jgi:hypothetical protein
MTCLQTEGPQKKAKVDIGSSGGLPGQQQQQQQLGNPLAGGNGLIGPVPPAPLMPGSMGHAPPPPAMSGECDFVEACSADQRICQHRPINKWSTGCQYQQQHVQQRFSSVALLLTHPASCLFLLLE